MKSKFQYSPHRMCSLYNMSNTVVFESSIYKLLFWSLFSYLTIMYTMWTGTALQPNVWGDAEATVGNFSQIMVVNYHTSILMFSKPFYSFSEISYLIFFTKTLLTFTFSWIIPKIISKLLERNFEEIWNIF